MSSAESSILYTLFLVFNSTTKFAAPKVQRHAMQSLESIVVERPTPYRETWKRKKEMGKKEKGPRNPPAKSHRKKPSETCFVFVSFLSSIAARNYQPPLLIFSAEPITSPSALRFPRVESGVRLPSLIAAALWLRDANAACNELGGIA